MPSNIKPLGPGQYGTVADLNGKGKYFIARHPSSGCSKIGNSKRFSDVGTISPGPAKCI